MPATANNVVPFPDKSGLGLHPLVDAAVFTYGGRGVIPVRPDTKRPYLKEWQLRGTANLQEVSGWWQQWPDALLGIVTGKESGVWMLDVDFRNGGDKTLAALEAKYGPLPKISAYTTPGGIRYPFKWQPGMRIRTTAGQFGDGLDVRGHRADGSGTGQAILPPSVTPKGVYARTPEWREGNVDYAPLWLLFLAAFPRRERDILAALGISGPADFGGAPPDQWQAIALEKIRSARGTIKPRGPRAPGEATQLVMPDPPLNDGEKAHAVTYIAGTVDKLCAEIAAEKPGEQEITLNNAGMRINGLVKGALYLGVDIGQLGVASYEKYCAACVAMVAEKGREPWLPDDAFRKWEHTGADAGPHELLSKVRPDKTAEYENVEPPAGGQQQQQGPQEDELVVVSGEDIVLTNVEWLWRNRLARGKPNILAGDQGLGKTTLLLDTMARITRGAEWPCGEGRAPKGTVIYLGVEDALDDTIGPRLVAAGADMTKVKCITSVKRADGKGKRSFSLKADLARLEALITKLGDAVLVVIDPLNSYFADADTYRTSEVRAILEPVSEMAARLRVTIIGNSHLSKDGKGRSANLRILDSQAITAIARGISLVAPDPSDPDRQLFMRSKGSNSPKGLPALAYTIKERKDIAKDPEGKPIDATYLDWATATVALSVDEVFGQLEDKGRATPAQDDAKEFLRGYLADGLKDSEDVQKAAKAHNISGGTLRIAQKSLGIVPKKNGLTGGWTWELPPAQAPDGF